jgi:hypothetical protein
MGAACCGDLVACRDDAACWACVTGADGDACESSPETHARVNEFLVCRGGPCQAECIGGPVGACRGALDGLVAEACAGCLEASCCDEVAACVAQETCLHGCLLDHDPAVCHADPDGHALYHALGQCTSSQCEAECVAPAVSPACDAPAEAPSAGACVTLGGAVQCNPVTSEGCAGEGEACDVAEGGGFACYPPPNEQALCAPCGQAEGWCAPGHTCVGACARYCCDDGDCGAGTCDKSLLEGGAVGVCVEDG